MYICEYCVELHCFFKVTVSHDSSVCNVAYLKVQAACEPAALSSCPLFSVLNLYLKYFLGLFQGRLGKATDKKQIKCSQCGNQPSSSRFSLLCCVNFPFSAGVCLHLKEKVFWGLFLSLSRLMGFSAHPQVYIEISIWANCKNSLRNNVLLKKDNKKKKNVAFSLVITSRRRNQLTWDDM